MHTKRGAHICAVYSTAAEFGQLSAEFIAEGLDRKEQCWYVAPDDDTDVVRRALTDAHIDVDAAVSRKALNFKTAEAAYIVHGDFNPETTLKIFNDAIEASYRDGFTAFRAVAEMSWVLHRPGSADALIEYEALLRALFETCRATGLCLYRRDLMPVELIGGALATHPFAASKGQMTANPRYDRNVARAADVEREDLAAALAQLDSPVA